MAWTKDAISEAPLVIYTPTDENPSITRVVYDRNAPLGSRYLIECSGITAADQSVEDVDAALGL